MSLAKIRAAMAAVERLGLSPHVAVSAAQVDALLDVVEAVSGSRWAQRCHPWCEAEQKEYDGGCQCGGARIREALAAVDSDAA